MNYHSLGFHWCSIEARSLKKNHVMKNGALELSCGSFTWKATEIIKSHSCFVQHDSKCSERLRILSKMIGIANEHGKISNYKLFKKSVLKIDLTSRCS